MRRGEAIDSVADAFIGLCHSARVEMPIDNLSLVSQLLLSLDLLVQAKLEVTDDRR
jgi:hypothetical protein